jgi:crotonobetaine/carnitine-CoA ligase
MPNVQAGKIAASDLGSDRASVMDLLGQRASTVPDTPLLRDLTAGTSFTNAEFHDESQRWAGALLQLNVEPGDRVAAMLPTSADAFLTQAALGRIGAVFVPLDQQLRGRPLARALSAARIRHVLTTQASLEANAEVLAATDPAARVVILDAEEPHHPAVDPAALVGRTEFLASRAELPTPGAVDPASTQAIIFTSGTSGPAKPVALSFEALDNYARYLFPDAEQVWPAGAAYYSPWTMGHALGSIALGVAATRGLRLVVRDGFSAGHFWSDVSQHNCQLALAINVTPSLWHQPPLPTDHLNPLRMLGVSPLFRQFREFELRFGLQVTTIYGTTEIGPAVTSRRPLSQHAAGVPSRGYECRIADGDGADVAAGEVGELLVRHARRSHIMTAYDGLEEATAAAWHGGWFHTGDQFVEELGQLCFVGRAVDSIRHHGHGISSFEIEEEVLNLADVATCACVAHETDLDGAPDEDVRLFVVPRQGRTASPEAIHRHLASRLPRFMLPRYIDVVEELPVNAAGKVLRNRLRQAPITGQTWDRHEDWAPTAQRPPAG